MATPPEAMTGNPVAASTAAKPGQVGAGQRPVPADLGDDHRGQSGAVEPGQGLGDADAGALLPAPDPDLAVAVVEADGHPARVGRGQPADQPGVLDRQRADHHPGHAPVEQRRRPGRRRPTWTGTPTAAAIASMTARLSPGPPGRVEVDDVDPAGPGRLERTGATATGSSPYTVSRSKSPWTRRTQRPPRRSIAG